MGARDRVALTAEWAAGVFLFVAFAFGVGACRARPTSPTTAEAVSTRHSASAGDAAIDSGDDVP